MGKCHCVSVGGLFSVLYCSPHSRDFSAVPKLKGRENVTWLSEGGGGVRSRWLLMEGDEWRGVQSVPFLPGDLETASQAPCSAQTGLCPAFLLRGGVQSRPTTQPSYHLWFRQSS